MDIVSSSFVLGTVSLLFTFVLGIMCHRWYVVWCNSTTGGNTRVAYVDLPGSTYRHKKNGTLYRVESIANAEADQSRTFQYPCTVNYMDTDGDLWSCSLASFYLRMSAERSDKQLELSHTGKHMVATRYMYPSAMYALSSYIGEGYEIQDTVSATILTRGENRVLLDRSGAVWLRHEVTSENPPCRPVEYPLPLYP